MLLVKIVLLVLLGLLVLVILLLLLALFYPVRYRAEVTWEKKPGVTVRAWWLFHALSFVYVTDTGDGMRIRVLGRLMGGKRERKDAKTAQKAVKTKTDRPEQANAPDPPDEVFEDREDATINKPKKERKTSLRLRAAQIIQTIKDVLRHPDRREIQRRAWILLKRLCKVLLPRRFRLTGVIGFDTPDKTGMTLGAIYCVLGAIPEVGSRVTIQGDFQQSRLELRAWARGSLATWSLLYPLARFTLSKPVWKLLKPHLFHNKSDKQ